MGPLEFAVISSGFIGEEYVESLINGFLIIIIHRKLEHVN